MAMKACVSTLLSIARPDANWEVTVLVPQLGGGYGGKEVQSNFTAIAAAFCTARLRVPVRIALSRETDMRMIGRRHPVEAAFTAAADRSTGRILALQLNVDADAGCTFDCTLPVADLVVLTADTAYNIEEFTVTMDSWFTNKASRFDTNKARAQRTPVKGSSVDIHILLSVCAVISLSSARPCGASASCR